MRWLQRFWYQDLPNTMQANMLNTISSNRPSLDNFVRRSLKHWKKMQPAALEMDARFRREFVNHEVVAARAANASRAWYDRPEWRV